MERIRGRTRGRVVTIVASPSLDRFQAQPIWEMSIKAAGTPPVIDSRTARPDAGELHDHLQERLEELVRTGRPRDRAAVQALEEFGDASVLAAHFTTIARLLRRSF